MSDFPYPGLRPFQRYETDIFFGREQHTDQLIEKLGNTHFVAVVGPSGCGKSSLVRTGLLAGLETGFLVQAGVRWRIAELRPGNQPFVCLAEALLENQALGPEYTANFTADSNPFAFLHAGLRRGSLSLHEILAETQLPERTNLLIVVDQFEELFRYYQQDSAYRAASFVALLLASSRHPAIYIVITMRSDFIGDCALFYDLPEAINQGLFLTPRLNRDQLRDAIEGPANVFDGDVEAVLVNRLLNDIGNDPDQLPLLQHALMRMWNLASVQNSQQVIITAKHYETIGGLTSALSNHADEAYEELNFAQQKIAEILFCNLTERGEGQRDIRRPVKLQEIATQANVSWQQVAEVVEVFRQAERSFLTPAITHPLEPDSMLDIGHESLIRQWKRLTQWTEKEAEFAKIYRRLEDTARLWEKRQAALLRTPELEIALKWRNEEQPNAHWAHRYGQHFDLAMRFLLESEQEQERESQEKEIAHQQKLKSARKTVVRAVFGLVIAIGFAVWAFVERHNALEQKQTALQAQLDSQLNNSAWLARFEDYAMAKTVLTKIPLNLDIPAPRRHARRLLEWFTQLMGSGAEYVYDVAKKPLFAIAISQDGVWVAAAGEDGALVLLNTYTNEVHSLKKHTQDIWTVAFHPSGSWLASAGDDRSIIFWSLPNGEKLSEWPVNYPVKAIAISPDGKYLASGGENQDNHITLWDIETEQPVKTLIGHSQRISDGGLAFNPTGEWLASASHDKTVRLWNVTTGKSLETLSGHTGKVEKAIFSPDNKLLATCSSDKTVRLWEIGTDDVKILHRLQGHEAPVYGLTFVAEGQHLVSASEDKTLRLWDTKSGVILRVLQGHVGIVNDIATHLDKLYSASNDETIRRWNATLPYQQLKEVSQQPISVAIAPDGKKLAVGFDDGALRVYSLAKHQLLEEKLTAHQDRITRLTFNTQGNLLASSSYDKTAKLWKVTPQELMVQQEFIGHTGKIYALALSPNDKLLATAGFDGQIGLFTVGSEQKPYFYQKAHHNQKIYSIAFNHKGSQLLSGGQDGYMNLWKPYDNRPIWSTNEKDQIRWASFSPDGSHVANVGRDSLVHVYEMKNDEEQYSLSGHRNTIRRVIFSPNSQQIATVSNDTTVRLWDLSNPIEHHLFTLNLPTNESFLVDFDFRCTPEGNCWIAVPLKEGRIALYELGQIYD